MSDFNENNVTVGNGSAKKPKSKKKKIIILVIIGFVVVGIFGNIMAQLDVGSPTGGSLGDYGNSFQTVPGDSVTDGTFLSKTIMMYMDGVDLEEACDSITKSIKAMLESDLDLNKVNILVYTGGTDNWDSFYGIPGDKDCIYLLRDGKLNLLTQYESGNMGDPEVLARFMDYCIDGYPAQQYGLVLANHGGGPNYGVCSDFRNNHDALFINELQQAFSSVGFDESNKMEFILFDACLMGSIEVAYGIKDYAHYMLSSENVSYTYGSDYTFVESFGKYNSGADIGKAYVDYFYKKSADLVYYGKFENPYDITYSCIDLSKVDAVETSLDTLFNKINSDITYSRNAMSAAYNARSVKEGVDYFSENSGATFGLIDLQDWLDGMSYMYLSEVADLSSAIKDMVTYNRASTYHMNGVTIYFPLIVGDQYNINYDSFDFSEEYTQFLEERVSELSYQDSWNSIASVYPQAGSSANSGKLCLQLTDSQKQSFASARYYVLAKYEGDKYDFKENQYVIATTGNNFTLSDDGLLIAEYDKRIPAFVADDGDIIPTLSTLYQYVDTDKQPSYKMNAGIHCFPDVEDYPGDPNDDDMVKMSWQFDNLRLDTAELSLVLQNNSDLRITYAELTGTYENMPSRMAVDISTYQDMQFFTGLWNVSFGSDSKPLPPSSWKFETSLMGNTVDIENLKLKLVDADSVSDTSMKYYSMIVVTDVSGNQYCSGLTELN